MNRLLLVLLLLTGFAAGMALFAPLGIALRLTGADSHSIGWDTAEGTVLNGRIQGLEIEGQPYGNAALQLQALALLSGKLRYTVDWTSEHGSGTGEVFAGSNTSIAIEKFSIDLDLLRLEQAALWIRQSGGRVQLQGQTIRFNADQCVQADGKAQSDVLERNREILGSGWSDMRGDLRCENGDLVIPLASENETGTRFLAQLRVAPGKPGRFEAEVSGIISRELEFALPIAGFTRDGRSYVYSHSTSFRSGPT